MQRQHLSESSKFNFDKTAFFSSLCMFLSMIEFAVPKPLPFMRIGFANMSVMLAIFVLPTAYTFLLVLLKVLVQGLISGTFFSYIFLFSFCGSFAALFFMLAAKSIFKSHVGFVGISLAGSLGNNLAQIALSYAIIFKQNTAYIAPVLLITGLVSSIVLGLFTQLFAEKSKWYAELKEGKNSQEIIAQSENSGQENPEQENTESVLERKKSKTKKERTRKFFLQLVRDLILLLSIVFFSLLIPSGKVLLTLGAFKITQNALLLGLKRALILILSVKISKLIVPEKIVLKGKAGAFLNRIFLYFKKLSSFELIGKRKAKISLQKTKGDENNSRQRESLIARLDEHLLAIY